MQKRGLSTAQASALLKTRGYNELKSKRKNTPLLIFFRQFKSFLIWILFAAALISVFINEMINFWVISGIILFITILGFIQEFKAEKAMASLQKIVQPTSTVMRNGKQQRIASRELVPGDLILLEAGDKVPADATIIDLNSLRIDESILTGESATVSKKVRGQVYAGTTVSQGKCSALVAGTGMNTKLGKIAGMIQVKEEETPLQKKINHLSKTLAFIAIGACSLIFVVGIASGAPLGEMLIVALALAVAAVPEGLALTLTLTLSFGMNHMAKDNAIVRKMLAVETLGSTTVICTDKTGTLTKNEMTVEKIYVDGKEVSVSGTGYAPEGHFTHKGHSYSSPQLKLLLQAATQCNNASLNQKDGQWNIIGDPTEAALVVAAAKANVWKDKVDSRYKRIKEIIFTSERKMMSTIHRVKGKQVLFAKGAAEVILKKCSHITINGEKVKMTPTERKAILAQNKTFAEHAYRVLGIATGKEENNMMFLGLTAMMDPAREGVKGAIATCQAAGIKVVMITGDNEITAYSIGREIGLITSPKDVCDIKDKKLQQLVVDGTVNSTQLAGLTDKQFELIVEHIDIYARMKPEQKLRIVKALKKKGHIVAMTGDGVNDAPSLKHADIGVAMGLKGTDVAKGAADIILQDDHFATIVDAVRSGRTIYTNIEKFTSYLISRNFTEVILIALGVVFLGFEFLPLLALQILFINAFDEEMPALALGLDPPTHEIMRKKPRKPGQPILNKKNAFLIFSVAAFMAFTAFGVFLIADPATNLEAARTMVFATIVGMVVFNTFNFRSLEESIFKVGVFDNKILTLSVLSIGAITGAALYVPFFQHVFELVPLGFFEWAVSLGAAFSTFVFMEVVKFGMRLRKIFGNPRS